MAALTSFFTFSIFFYSFILQIFNAANGSEYLFKLI